MFSSVVNHNSTPPVITGTLQRQPHSQWRTLRFWSLVFVGLFLLSSHGFWRSSASPSVDTAPVHPDQTRIKTPVHQVPPTVMLIYQNPNGDLVKVPVQAERYSEWVHQQMKTLETARQIILGQVQVEFAQGLDELFQSVKDRIPCFADWYFSYGTSYQLLWEAMTSAITHLGADTIKEVVSADIEELIQSQYEYVVLRPEILDAEIQRRYQHILEQAHQAYLRTLAAMEENFQVFVSQHTSYVSDSPTVPELHLDWVAQVHTLRIAPDVHTTLGAVRGIILTTIGVMVGKGIGLQVGSLLATRLALPFTQRAVTTVSSGVVGTGSGSIAGPLGATAGLIIGAAVGLAVDWTVNLGVELFSRADFERTVQDAVSSTQTQWQDKLLVSLLQSVDIEFDDTIQLLLQF